MSENVCLNPHNNGPSLTGVIDRAAHSISLFQENEEPQDINNIFIPKSDSRVAEPYDIQIDETGNNMLTMYHFIGEINDTKVGALESLSNYMNENFFNKYDPATDGHHCNLAKNTIQ